MHATTSTLFLAKINSAKISSLKVSSTRVSSVLIYFCQEYSFCCEYLSSSCNIFCRCCLFFCLDRKCTDILSFWRCNSASSSDTSTNCHKGLHRVQSVPTNMKNVHWVDGIRKSKFCGGSVAWIQHNRYSLLRFIWLVKVVQFWFKYSENTIRYYNFNTSLRELKSIFHIFAWPKFRVYRPIESSFDNSIASDWLCETSCCFLEVLS